jgi:hypothetical protein
MTHLLLGVKVAGLSMWDGGSTVYGGQDGFSQLVVVDRFMMAVAVRGINIGGGGEVAGQHRVFREWEEDQCVVTSMGRGRR